MKVVQKDNEERFLSSEEYRFSSMGAVSTVLVHGLPSPPAHVARSSSRADVARHLTSTSPPRSYAEVLGSGVLKAGAFQGQCVEEPFGIDFYDELEFPGLEGYPSKSPSSRSSSRGSPDLVDLSRTNPGPLYPRELTRQRPVMARSLMASCTANLHSKKTSSPLLRDRAGNRVSYAPHENLVTQSTTKTSTHISEYQFHMASPSWSSGVLRPGSALTTSEQGQKSMLPFYYRGFMNDSADLPGHLRTYSHKVDRDFQGLSDPTRFALTNQRVAVVDRPWTFSPNEFEKFRQADFSCLWSPFDEPDRAYYNPFTSRLHPGVWLDHSSPPVW